jgi:Bacterial Ig-like domain (group 3)
MTNLWNSHRGALRQNARRSCSRACRPGVELFEQRTLLSAVIWTGGAGTDDWDAPANWSTDSLPGSGDSVTIGSGATVVHSDNDSDSINSLTSSGTLEITGGSLAIASASTAGALTVNEQGSPAALTVNDSLTVSGPLTIGDGALSGAGTITASGGIVINSAGILDGITLDNAAGQTASFASSSASESTITAKDGAVFNNYGTFLAEGSFNGSTAAGATTSFNNDGSLVLSTQNSVYFTGETFNSNGGTVDVQAGTLHLDGGGTVTNSTFTVETGADLGLGGAFNFDSTSTIEGAGSVSFEVDAYNETATINMNGTYDVTGATAVAGAGTTTVDFDGAVDSVGASLSAQSGKLNFNSPFIGTGGTIPTVLASTGGTLNFGANDLTATTLTVTGIDTETGTVTGTGIVTVTGLLTLAGTLSGAGTFDADGGITINDVPNAADVSTIDGATLNNAAGQTATWSVGSVYLEGGAVFNNMGTFNIPAPSLAGDFIGSWAPSNATSGSFNNDGSFIDSSGSPATNCYFAVPFDSSGGTVDVQSGGLGLLDGGNSTGGTFTAESGQILEFSGLGTGVIWTFGSSSSIGGAGTITFGGQGTINMNGTYDVTGTTTGAGEHATVNFNGPLESIGSSLVVSTNFNFNSAFVGTAGTIGTVDITADTLNLGANNLTPTTLTIIGTLSGTGTITVTGPLNLEQGTISGSCTVNADGGISLVDVDSGAVFNLDGCTFNNPAGQTITPGSGEINVLFNCENGAVFNNLGTIDATAQFLFDGASTGTESSFSNEGTFIVNYPLTAAPNLEESNPTTFQDVAFNDDGGSVDAKQGGLVFEGGGSSTGGSFTIESGAVFNIGSSPPYGYTFDAATTLSGAGSFTVSCYQDLVIFAGTSARTGPTTISAGTLQVDGSQPTSAVTDGVQNGASADLTGAGTVGPITAAASTISPGDSNTEPGILTADGDVSLDSASTFSVALNGATAGTGYDQLNATGSVSLGGSTLAGTLGFTPSAGETFTIIKSTTPITGTFAGLPEGASVKIGGVPFTISYAADGGDDAVLTSGASTIVASKTTLSSSANLSNVGQSVVFTATVDPASGSGRPTGTVTFTIDGRGQTPSSLSVVGGVDEATFSTRALAAGSHTISAAYSGDTTFAASTSTALTQTVIAPTATTLSSSANTSLHGQPVTFTANVTGPSGAGTPSGSVSFDEGSATLASVALDAAGQATFTTATLAAGSDAITAVYVATGSFVASSSAPLTHLVNSPELLPTSTQVASSVNPSTVGQTVIFTATVAPTSGSGTPTGTVTFTIDGQGQTPSSLSVVGGVDESTFTTSSLAAGPHTVSAAYSGDTTYAASTASTLTQPVNARALEASVTQLHTSADPSTVGQTVVFTATVAPTTGSVPPTGTVTFSIDGKASSPVALTGVDGKDQATLTMPAAAAGSYTITASYSGDSSFSASSSSTTEVVAPPVILATVDGPTVVSLLRYGYHMRPTTVVLTFDQALDELTAEDDANYRIIGPAGRVIGIKSAVYDPATLSVTLRPEQRMNIHHTYELVVDGTAPHGVTNTFGQLLDGTDSGHPDSDYRAPLSWRNLVLDPVPEGMARWAEKTTATMKPK